MCVFCVPKISARKVLHALTLKSKQGDLVLLAAARGREAGHKTIVSRLNSERISLKSEFNCVLRFDRVVLHKEQVLLKKIFQV